LRKRLSRILIETTVKKALKNIRHSPERSVRNLIDMALQFSDGRFQKYFFTEVRTMLQNENSAYYQLIRDVITHVDTEKLYTFGFNIGYNSCTEGAQRIRENEKLKGCNITWTICEEMDTEQFGRNQHKYDDMITEGENSGIYTWMFFVLNQPGKMFSLIEKHPESAFCIFCDTKDITPAFLEEAAMLQNLMVIVRYDENAADVCTELRANKMLYSVWYQYGQKDTDIIINGDLFHNAQQLLPVFTVLIPEKTCPKEVHQVIYSKVKQTRLAQLYSTIAWDLKGDNRLIDTIISDDAFAIE
jgi:hypothetical protein